MRSLFALVLVMTTCAGANALKPKGEPAAALTLIHNDKSDYAIIVPVDETPQETKASEDLQHWFKEITGHLMLNVVGDSARNQIRIKTDPRLPDEGYRIEVEGKHLI